MTNNRFDGRIAVITGGASGIGAATARLMAREGAVLVLADINEAAGQAMVSELGSEAASFVRTDVADKTQVEALIDHAVAKHGRIDILFNNAGIGSFGNTVETPPEQWEQVIAIDLNAVFYASHYAIPHMPNGGAIVNTASISGLGGDHRFAAYNAAKGAVINYTRSMAVDHARNGIRVNALCPGLVDTPIISGLWEVPGLKDDWTNRIPLKRAAKPEEMAEVVAFLASDAASYVTGSIVVADGGSSACTGQPEIAAFVPAESLLQG